MPDQPAQYQTGAVDLAACEYADKQSQHRDGTYRQRSWFWPNALRDAFAAGVQWERERQQQTPTEKRLLRMSNEQTLTTEVHDF